MSPQTKCHQNSNVTKLKCHRKCHKKTKISPKHKWKNAIVGKLEMLEIENIGKTPTNAKCKFFNDTNFGQMQFLAKHKFGQTKI